MVSHTVYCVIRSFEQQQSLNFQKPSTGMNRSGYFINFTYKNWAKLFLYQKFK